MFLEVCRWVSIMRGFGTESATRFAALVSRLVDAWPAQCAEIRAAVENLSRAVPLEQAVSLRPLILRLRTM